MTQVSATHHETTVDIDAARILVVDDEQHMCDICSRALTQAGYDVVASTDVSLALEELRSEHSFDLLLIDIQMPTMSGLEVAQYARELDPAIAIIIMSGHASMENLREAVRRGIADFLSKPFEIDQLRIAVVQALHKRLLLQESIRMRSLEQLLDSSEAINAILDQRRLGQTILERSLDHLRCRVGFLIMKRQEQTSGVVLAHPSAWTLLKPGYDAVLQAAQGGSFQIIKAAEALCSNETDEINQGVILPLRAKGEVLGILLLCDNNLAALRLSEQDTLTLLTNQASTALYNARLYHQLEEAYQSLRELDRLKSEFITIASHELRTPLSIILGYSVMVRDQSEGKHSEYAQRVIDSGEQIKEIVDNMVSLRDLDLRETKLNLEACSLEALVQHVVERLEPTAQSNQQTFETQLLEQDITFLADREKALLVLSNLVANAVKFTASGGSICLRAEVWPYHRIIEATQQVAMNPTLRQLNEHTVDEWVVLQIEDTGVGIAPQEQARIFNRFYQAGPVLTRDHGGAGLGLAIVADLMALQDGAVWVTSVEGQGSTFFCALPCIAA